MREVTAEGLSSKGAMVTTGARPPTPPHPPCEFIFLSITHTHTCTRTQSRGVVTLMDIFLLLNKFLMSRCGLTGALRSIPPCTNALPLRFGQMCIQP